ncbi:hypothetical protein BJ742DRAFT_830453 [Cladochytrium replicatum]|nr:hypothetical protein BJ742DRAFT_830453 [Cladochytrium replicatum]
MDGANAEELLAAALNDVREALAITGASTLTHRNTTNASSSGGAQRPPRTWSISACDRCYSRKIRCPSTSSDEPCSTCLAVGVECTYGHPEHRTRRRKKKTTAQTAKAATKNVGSWGGDEVGTQSLERLESAVAPSTKSGLLTTQLQQLVWAELADGGTPAEELMSNLGLHSMFTSNGAALPISMPNASCSVNSDAIPVGPLPYFASASQFGHVPVYINNPTTTFPLLFGTTLPQIPSIQLPTPILKTPTPIVESPSSLLSRRQKEELIDAYFNFINPSMPFLHPGHFWNEFRAERVPVFLLDAIFGLAVRFTDPRMKTTNAFGVSLYGLSQRNISREESEHSRSESPSSSKDSSNCSSATPRESERSWNDLDYREFSMLSKSLPERALEWVPKLKERQASISLVHTFIILMLMEMGRARPRFNMPNLVNFVIRMATFLSFNVDVPGKPFEKNIRRRTWWCLLLFEANTALRMGTNPNLPPSYKPSFPDTNPNDGSATGAWSPEATRAFNATADIGRVMVQELRAVDTSADRFKSKTDQFLDRLNEWESHHASALLLPRSSNDTQLNLQNVYTWVQSTSAIISKHAAILICLRPAALAFQLGADEHQDWSSHIRHPLAGKFRPSYSAWIATQNAARSISDIVEKIPYQVLSRNPFLDIFVFPAVALQFQTLLHTSDPNIIGECARTLSKLCSALSNANPYGKGMMYSRITDFCVRFARLYLEHDKGESIFAPIIEQSKKSTPSGDGEQCPLSQQPEVTELRDESAEEVASSYKYDCEGIFMEPDTRVQPTLPHMNDWSKQKGPSEITMWDFKEMELSLMGSIPEIKNFIFKHLEVPQEGLET